MAFNCQRIWIAGVAEEERGNKTHQPLYNLVSANFWVVSAESPISHEL
jgi:hypothetical protein